MTNLEKFEQLFPNLVDNQIEFEMFNEWGDLFRVVTSIDVPNNRIGSTYYYIAECGCCSDSDDDMESLDDLNYMSSPEFEGLIKELSK